MAIADIVAQVLSNREPKKFDAAQNPRHTVEPPLPNANSLVIPDIEWPARSVREGRLAPRLGDIPLHRNQ